MSSAAALADPTLRLPDTVAIRMMDAAYHLDVQALGICADALSDLAAAALGSAHDQWRVALLLHRLPTSRWGADGRLDHVPGIIDIQSATYDDPDLVPARVHIQVAERIAWMTHIHEPPEFERYPPAK